MTGLPSYLEEILGARASRSRSVPPATRPERVDFQGALRRARPAALIAEVKVASPSRGRLLAGRSPEELARVYQEGGAAAISVVTEEHFFQGSLELLRRVREAVDLPVLRKDFLTEAAELEESAAFGASAVLLIARILDDRRLGALLAHARTIPIDVLVEVHDEVELGRAVAAGAAAIGVNNRDLATFAVDLAVSERLGPLLPPTALRISESGIHDAADVARLRRAGYDAFLVGEALIRSGDPGALVASLKGAA